MVRKLKFHEQKLLKKVDYVNWSSDNNVHEGKILRKFAIRKREHYSTYNTLARQIRDIAQLIRDLPDKNPNKAKLSRKLLTKLFDMGLIPSIDSLERCDTVSASSFCRRRLASILVHENMSSSFCRRRLASILVHENMCKDIGQAAQFVEQGHVRIGAELITDPAFLVTRTMSDLVTWTNASKIRKHVESYNNIRDDFEE
uniref:U3 small nucleolar ribonucleoprotein IMP3 n=1 Tax=Panagrolaimus sp. PS1159 TaxID=55785 RepID=A0AC35GXT9_9BILA